MPKIVRLYTIEIRKLQFLLLLKEIFGYKFCYARAFPYITLYTTWIEYASRAPTAPLSVTIVFYSTHETRSNIVIY